MKKSKRIEAQLSLAKQFISHYQPTPAHPLLESKREAAKEFIMSHGLPVYREEDYQYFKIDEWLSKEWQIPTMPQLTEQQAKEYACLLTYPHAHQAFMIGGRVASTTDSEDFFAGSITQFAERYPDIATRYYSQMKSAQESRLTQLNTLYTDDLFVYYIPQGSHVKGPIHLIHYASDGQLACSAQPNRKKVATVTWDQIKTIAEDKMTDLNCFTVESAMKLIAGTARSMGIAVQGEFPGK